MKLRSLPPTLLERQTDAQRAKTMAWWAGLGDAAQTEFEQLWDARAEDAALYGACADDGTIVWHEIPIELRGMLIDEENDREHAEMKRQLLEYISNHEDIQFFLVNGNLHICRGHPAARAAIAAGQLPASFVCPLDDTSCPMRAILATCPGRSVRLEPALRVVR